VAGIHLFKEIAELHHVTETAQTARLDNFHIYRNEDADKTCRQSMFLHQCDFFQLSIDRQSDYKLLHNSSQINTTNNSIYFVGAGKLASWHVEGNKRTWRGYNIIFKHDFLSIGASSYNFCKEFPFLRRDSTATVSIPTHTEIFDLCERMLYEQNGTRDINILRHYLYVLLYIIKRLYVQQHCPEPLQHKYRNAELAERFEELVDQYYLDYKSIDAYAAKLFVTPRYLSQVTRDVYGKTAKELVMTRVMEEARSLLVQTPLSVTEIASRLGFHDTSNFIKFFKKLSGQGPTDFRKTATGIFKR
jgi:AraC family transcriptional regulator, transcriptional activator of pobA